MPPTSECINSAAAANKEKRQGRKPILHTSLHCSLYLNSPSPAPHWQAKARFLSGWALSLLLAKLALFFSQLWVSPAATPCWAIETHRTSPAVPPLSSCWGTAQKAHVSVGITQPYLNDLLCYLPGFVNIQGYLGVPYKRVKRPSFAEATGKEEQQSLKRSFKILEGNKSVILDVQLVFLSFWQNPSPLPLLRNAILKNFKDEIDLHLCGCTHVPIVKARSRICTKCLFLQRPSCCCTALTSEVQVSKPERQLLLLVLLVTSAGDSFWNCD